MVLLILIILGVLCAAVAHSKGRNVIGWFFIGFFLGLIGLILVLVVSNLKEAKEKEAHLEMEQRRLREQLRQERLKTEQFHKYARVRLDTHDQELNIDTRHVGPLLAQANIQPILDNSQGLSEQVAGVEPEEKSTKMKTQCPHCQARFKLAEEHKGKKAKCSKCGKGFVVAPFVDSMAVQECTRCGRKVEGLEYVRVVDGRVICKHCEQTAQKGSQQTGRTGGSWYYQEGDTMAGPFSIETVRRLAKEGKINSSTLVWHESLDKWTAAGKVGELGNGDWPWIAAE
jgi:predicted Zn finger-like uncharacterized protein